MVKITGIKFTEKLHEEIFQKLLSLMDIEHKSKIQKFKFWQDQHRGLFGKLLLFKLLKEEFNISEFPEIFYDQYNRPYQKISSGYDFNISHSGEFVFCAISDNGKIGIDVEKKNDISLDIAHRFFSKKEVEYLSGISNEKKNETMIRLWTLKESYIKAKGSTFLIPLNEFFFDISDIENIVFQSDITDENNLWKFHYYPLENGHHLSVCIKKENDITSLSVIDTDIFLEEFLN